MEAIKVIDKKSEKAFFKVPRIIYADDPNWIPHLKQDIQKIFDPSKNKLFKGGQAARWVFYHNNNLVGRVAAFVLPEKENAEEQPTGGMGFFECIDDQDLANTIFDTVKDWLADRGMEAMDGPINFGERNQFWGCLTENFTAMNNYGMNYNPPYYPALFEQYGFKTYFEQYLFKRRIADPVHDVFKRRIELLQKRYNVRVSNLEGVSLANAAEYFRTVYNEAWGGYSDFSPMTAEASQGLMKELKPVIEKRILIFAFHKEEPIGFFVNIPELNEIFRYVNGNLNMMGKLKFLYHKWKGTPRTMVGLVFGVAKEWQGRGIEGAMINWASEYFTEHPIYDDIVLTWIGDFNPRMLKVAEKIGAKKFREMKTYRYLFDREKPFKRYPVVE